MKKIKIKKLNENINEDTHITVKDLNIDQIVPNIIENFLITIIDGHQTLIIPSNASGLQFKEWMHRRGGIFSKDVLYHSLNKKIGKYVLIKGSDINCIARIIEDDEHELFESLRLIDGKIKDNLYMILRNLKDGDELTNTNKNIHEEIIEEQNEMLISINQRNDNKDEEEAEHLTTSVSLISD